MGLFATDSVEVVPYRAADFNTLTEALEYAALSDEGINFYDGRGQLECAMSYRQLLQQALELAGRLTAAGYPRGSRVAVVGETDPIFPVLFFACQYAGLLPVALPASVQVGARDHYVSHLRTLLTSCGAALAVAPESHFAFIEAAAQPLSIDVRRLQDIGGAGGGKPGALTADGPAYLQYTSGSTSAPRGVEVSQVSVMTNLQEMARNGLHVGPNDRFVSWLPLYHDMGLVGLLLLPLATQCSVDLISPRTFAMRPRLWLKLLSDNRGTITSSPPFGYALCAKRLRPSDVERYDLSGLRAACVGAERIQPGPMRDFAEALAPSGFDAKAFVACYGMAETALAVSFAPLNTGLEMETVYRRKMETELVAEPVPDPATANGAGLTFIDCGVVLPTYEVSVRDQQGRELGERECGVIWLRGPCVMQRYFQNAEATAKIIDADGWLNTGDIGYRRDDRLFITARSKEVIIINGRNIWPQDLEILAEELDGVRGASAFSMTTRCGEEIAVILVEARSREPGNIEHLIAERVHQLFGVKTHIEVIAPGELPRTSSGKLSRAKTKQDFLAGSLASADRARERAIATSETA